MKPVIYLPHRVKLVPKQPTHRKSSHHDDGGHHSRRQMEPGLWGRTIHKDRARSRSPRPGSGSRSRSRARESYLEGDDEFRDTDYDHSEGYRSDDLEEEDADPYIRVPSCMLGQPLKDFDSGQDNTFVVVNTKFGKQVVYRFSKEKSLFIFGTSSSIRRVNIYIFTHQYFEMFILLTIFVNCIFMALSKPPELSEYIFAAIYTIEMIVKILAKGFILHQYSYLRNSWNWLDFIVVVLGYVTMTPWVNNLDGFRTFRVLRALKTISTVKGLKAMVNTLLKSMKMMTDVLILTLFFISIFALIGLQLFPGKLRSRCVKNRGNLSIYEDEFYKQEENWYYDKPSDTRVICGNSSTSWNCPSGYTCIEDAGPNPGKGYVSYDSFPAAMLTSLQVCTLDYWEIVFNSVISACGEAYMIYFLLAVFLGPFYLLNLVLAVVSASYEMEVNGNPDPAIMREQRAQVKRTSSTYSFDGDTYVEFLTGQSPIEEVDGAKRYTVPNAPKKKEKPHKEEINYYLPPELGDNPTFRLRVRAFFFKVVSSSFFEGIIITSISLNTAFMATEYHDMNVDFKTFLDMCNYVFTGVFAIEMIFKIMGFTFRGYLKNNWNIFDGTLVIFSLLDVLLTETGAVSGGPLSVLKVFRLMRVLKLAQSWKTMGQLLSTIASSMGALGNVTVILGLIIYIFSVVGMQIFGSYYKKENFAPCKEGGDKFPRYNFLNFGNSFMMIFRILCGKWIEPQWELLQLSNAASIIFIFLVFVIGRWVVLNLFLALLLSSFAGLNEGGDEDDEKPKKTRLQRLIEWSKKVKKKKRKKNKGDDNNIQINQENEDLENRNFGMLPETMHVELNNKDGVLMVDKNANDHKLLDVNNENDNNLKPTLMNHDLNMSPVRNGGTLTNGGMNRRPLSGSVDIDIPLSVAPTEGFNTMGDKDQSLSSVKIEIQREKTYVDDCLCSICYKCNCCYTSYLDSPARRSWHRARYYTRQFIEHKYFEAVILFLIAFSSLTLVFEDVHLDSKKGLKDFLFYCNYFFAIIFTLEFLIKLFALGFVKYFTNFWNLLDVFIVAISLSSLAGSGSGGGNLKALRSLRGLRPLRAISRFEGMKVVVNALVYSIPSIANVLLVCLAFWLIFSIMGYNLFGGKFWRCVDKNNEKLSRDIVQTRQQCIALATNNSWTWRNQNINFDSALDGFLALFQTATLEGWFEAMADAYDAIEIDSQPGYMENYFNQLYFVVFILLGAFFILNLFIGVIIDNFNRLKQQYEDGVGIFLTPGQRNWINTLKAASLKKPSRRLTAPTTRWRATLFDFIQTKYFEFFIMSVILLNMLTMMIQHHNQPEEVGLALDYLNLVFTGIFTIEAIIRLIAMRLEYFKYGMNVFDFVIVVFSIADIILTSMETNVPIQPGLFRVIRILRVGRLLRFVEAARGVRQLIFTITKSAPALSNVGTLLFLVVFIYAILGMSMFGNVKYSKYITPVTNFETWFSSMCLLFRVATAAGWNNVLEGLSIAPPYCDPDKIIPGGGGGITQGDCGNKAVAIVYLVTYMFLIVQFVVNMYIAVILENFNDAQNQENIGITEDAVEDFYEVWKEFDPKAKQLISYDDLGDFLDQVCDPFRIEKPNEWFLETLKCPMREGKKIHCLDLLQILIKKIIGDDKCVVDETTEKVMIKLEKKFKKKFPARNKKEIVGTTDERYFLELDASRKIQRTARWYFMLNDINLLMRQQKITAQNDAEQTIKRIEQSLRALLKTKARRIEKPKIQFTLSNEDDNDNDELFEDSDENHIVETPLL